ncbi:MAG: PspC domain-containing protein [Bacteroides sp.]|nr:PspC domain-containing protein [Bacteroides sp.]MCM1447025.1 PspC domain-containing protein [Bacteroides sp.]
MKKNITINLFGTLYNIDEDAYQLLENYLQSMKRYFGHKDGGEEIANDIEHRVAELLWEKKEHGMEAVNQDIIKKIIGTIGNAKEIAGVDSEEDAGDEYGTQTQDNDSYDATTATLWQKIRHHFKNRNLYRDPDNMIIGGVCSGMSYYIGFGDPIIWRLLLILLLLFKGIGLLAYLILWLIIPLARTPEDKLRMKGVQPTPDSINQQILQDHTNQENRISGSRQNNGSGCLKVLLGLLLLPPLFFIIIFFGAGTIGLLGVFAGFTKIVLDGEMAFVRTIMESTGAMMLSGLGCTLIVLVIILIVLVRWLFGSRQPMRIWVKMTLLIAAVLCLAWAVYSISRSISRIYSLNEERDHSFVTASSRKPKPQPHLDVPYLNETGFSVITNNTIRCTWSGDYPTGDGEKRYLDASNYPYTVMFTAEKADTVKPGFYDLYALVRAEDEGAFVYAKSRGIQILQAIPAEGNEHGNLWKWACGNATIPMMQEAYQKFWPDSIKLKIASANDSQGFGWSVVSIKNINVGSDGIVAYGISTDTAFTKEKTECEWVSATDFVLVPAKKNK